MSIPVKDDFKVIPTPSGLQQAVCVFVNDIGIQEGMYAGEKTLLHKIIITWELKAKIPEGDYAGQPFMVSKYYTLSLGEKANLRKDLESWRGKKYTQEEAKAGIDVEKLIGQNCYLNITLNEKNKAVINTVNPLPEGVSHIAPVNKVMSEKFKKWIDKERAKAVDISTAQPEHEVVPFGEVPPPDDLPF